MSSGTARACARSTATPFPLALHCVGSVLAVKGTLRRFAPLTARTDPRGAVTRRAVAQHRSRASGLTRLSA